MALTKKILNYFYLFILLQYLNYSINSDTTAGPNLTKINQLIKTSLAKQYEDIEGCPDVHSFNKAVANLTYTQLSKISCLCGSSDDSEEIGVSINCIYGSTLQDLQRVLTLATAANIPVHKVNFLIFKIKINLK